MLGYDLQSFENFMQIVKGLSFKMEFRRKIKKIS
jgi:hypothetical protein